MGPCKWVTVAPSSSRLTCDAPASRLTGAMSKRTATVVLPGAKNMSRMTAARWNWAMSAGETGAATPSADCAFQTLARGVDDRAAAAC